MTDVSSYLINFTLVASRGLALGGWMIMPIYFLIYSEGVMPNIEGVIKSLDLHLTSEDIRYLEEPYVPHNLSGVMAVNKLCYRSQLLFFENIFGVIIYKL